jgi:phosphoglycolate phosphatase-like HAD superfamily hydrolase
VSSQDLNRVVDWIVANDLRACCFDFGGTLYDFLPIHIAGFRRALNMNEGDEREEVISRVVIDALANGLDSIHMAEQLIGQLDIVANPVYLAVQKREYVESLTNEEALTPDVGRLLFAVIQIVRVAVITRGLVSSTAAILFRSLPEAVARTIVVRGRRDLMERPNKTKLLLEAIAEMEASTDQTGYVADADDDAAIANRAGVPFLRVSLFN